MGSSMNLHEISLSYSHCRLTVEQIDLLKTISFSTVSHEDKPDDSGKFYVFAKPLVDDAGLGRLAAEGIQYSVVKTRPLTGPEAPAIAQRETGAFNSKVQVHVAGLGLLNVTEVENHNDCCTEYLQEKLADGWRILAVCVQPDQRRPDYILGRSKGEVSP
jgi:hypothetical protein